MTDWNCVHCYIDQLIKWLYHDLIFGAGLFPQRTTSLYWFSCRKIVYEYIHVKIRYFLSIISNVEADVFIQSFCIVVCSTIFGWKENLHQLLKKCQPKKLPRSNAALIKRRAPSLVHSSKNLDGEVLTKYTWFKQRPTLLGYGHISEYLTVRTLAKKTYDQPVVDGIYILCSSD